MKKILISFALFFFTVSTAFAGYEEVKKNYQKIKTIKTRVNTIIKNKQGTTIHRGQYIIKGNDQKRYDEIIPSRCVFILNKDKYSYFNLSDKQIFKKRIKDLSEAHLIFIEQLFLPEVFSPVRYLEDKYNFEKKPSGSIITGHSKAMKDARVKITLKRNIIEKIEFYIKDKLTKKITYSGYREFDNINFPHIVKTTIYNKTKFEIISSFKKTDINQDTNDDCFRNIIPD